MVKVVVVPGLCSGRDQQPAEEQLNWTHPNPTPQPPHEVGCVFSLVHWAGVTRYGRLELSVLPLYPASKHHTVILFCALITAVGPWEKHENIFEIPYCKVSTYSHTRGRLK